jgi:uncharacterized protein YraI
MTRTRLALCAAALMVAAATDASAATAFVLTNVNLRSGPATTNDIVVLIPAGSMVDASNCTDGWCAVTWRNKSGFAIQTALDTSGRPPMRYGAPEPYDGDPSYPVPPPPAVYVGPPAVIYGPGYGPGYGYYGPYGPGWHRRW